MSKAPLADSKRIAGLVGPTIVAMTASELALVQPHLYDAQMVGGCCSRECGRAT